MLYCDKFAKSRGKFFTLFDEFWPRLNGEIELKDWRVECNEPLSLAGGNCYAFATRLSFCLDRPNGHLPMACSEGEYPGTLA